MAHPVHLHRARRIVRLLHHEALHQRHIHRLVTHLHGFQDGVEVFGRECLVKHLGKGRLRKHLPAQFIRGCTLRLRVALPETCFHVIKGGFIAHLRTVKGCLLIGLLAEKSFIGHMNNHVSFALKACGYWSAFSIGIKGCDRNRFPIKHPSHGPLRILVAKCSAFRP